MHQRKHEGYCEIRGDQMGEKNNKNNKIIGWAAAFLEKGPEPRTDQDMVEVFTQTKDRSSSKV